MFYFTEILNKYQPIDIYITYPYIYILYILLFCSTQHKNTCRHDHITFDLEANGYLFLYVYIIHVSVHIGMY